MKLRNKKTGEIVNYDSFCFRKDYILSDGWEDFVPNANSLAELNAEWEDYTPQETLIKDEKIRKAVRAWAEINKAKELHQWNNCQLEDEANYLIEFEPNCFDNLEVGKNYTITELCGEEE